MPQSAAPNSQADAAGQLEEATDHDDSGVRRRRARRCEGADRRERIFRSGSARAAGRRFNRLSANADVAVTMEEEK